MEEEWDITVTVQSLCNRRQVIDFDFFPYGEAPDLSQSSFQEIIVSELESGKDEESELSGDDEKKEDGEESDKDETQGKTLR